MTGAAAQEQWTCATCGRAYPAELSFCPLDATQRAAAAPTDPMIGEVLAHTYRITRLLGQGGMARLYEAEHLRTDARYAVKVIHDDLARDPAQLARFEREARAAGRIHSEHVVRLVDVLRTADNRPCIVTELLDGEDLQALLDRVGKLHVADAAILGRQICRAVAAAHAVGVIHRDLKPSNVFVCKGPKPLVKVFDFGIAKVEDDEKLTRTDAVIGTAAYMAPEQARSARDTNAATDVYAIGAILYHMLVGQPPYGNVPAVSRYALLLHEEPTRPRDLAPDLPDAVEAVIQHAMARDRTLRIASPQALEAQLAIFDKPTPAAAPEAPILRTRFTRKLAGIVAAGSSIAIGAWTAALFAAFVNPTSRSEHALIAVLAVVATGALAALHVRRLRPIWPSLPAVNRYIEPFADALLGAVVTAGAVALVAWGSFAMFAATPVALGAHVALVAVAAVLGAGRRRWKLDERVRRRFG